jgi:hypothetical protein
MSCICKPDVKIVKPTVAVRNGEFVKHTHVKSPRIESHPTVFFPSATIGSYRPTFLIHDNSVSNKSSRPSHRDDSVHSTTSGHSHRGVHNAARPTSAAHSSHNAARPTSAAHSSHNAARPTSAAHSSHNAARPTSAAHSTSVKPSHRPVTAVAHSTNVGSTHHVHPTAVVHTTSVKPSHRPVTAGVYSTSVKPSHRPVHPTAVAHSTPAVPSHRSGSAHSNAAHGAHSTAAHGATHPASSVITQSSNLHKKTFRHHLLNKIVKLQQSINRIKAHPYESKSQLNEYKEQKKQFKELKLVGPTNPPRTRTDAVIQGRREWENSTNREKLSKIFDSREEYVQFKINNYLDSLDDDESDTDSDWSDDDN